MNDKPIKFYVDSAWHREIQHVPLLYPFWGNCLDRTRVPFQHALFERHNFDTSLYNITENKSEADMVLMPYSYNIARRHAPDLLEECYAEAERQGKFMLIDGTGDIEYPITLRNTVVLRGGGYRFSRVPNDIIIPLFADDLLEIYCNGELQIRQKEAKAKVGFSGWADLTLKQETRAIIKEFPNRIRSIFDSRYGACKKGVFFRQEAISALQNSSFVESNFLIRRSYSGHSDDAVGDQAQLHREFVNNLLESDYGLDVRGDANASMRLFEILSLGRIPIIVDTERNFPFKDKIDYSSFALIVDFRDIKKLPEIIADFHKNISPDRFVEMQKSARAVYLNYFRVDAITKPLMELVYRPTSLGQVI